ncbi:hypothetical protein M409DRAFT_58308 [Zasmidium cellare ATCC 36951]|uniref:Methyltransferase domain-containing protein n=1 Tax=Zasmidium cellare ATCC 36951 TaxID=1080233 RepID=A0A6A6C8K8_ZASCE|nr:uncharacterized protein M409DRAFT_58308 [Zasmidium cellare ATCC 36951]KAF2162570.1 hypothetical protein M409DRAFT_58308 [Zasmidium cellare ATCC 36951]
MATNTSPQENSQMSPAFNTSLGHTYETFFGHDAGLLKFLDLLLTHLPPASRVLDIGCGTGNPVASTLSAASHRVTGIDISEEMVRLSRKAVPEGVFEMADMQRYQPDGEVGAVLAILSLFPLGREAIEAQVGRWRSWVPVGGLLGVGTIAAEDVDVEGKGGEFDADGGCARGIQVRFMGADVEIDLFTRSGWERLLEREGFEVLADLTELHVPPREANSDEEVHWFFAARRVR